MRDVDSRQSLWELLIVGTVDIGPVRSTVASRTRSLERCRTISFHGRRNFRSGSRNRGGPWPPRVRGVRAGPEPRLEDLWQDLVLAQYLDGILDREDAIERVGRTNVERMEREREAVAEDIDWGLNA